MQIAEDRGDGAGDSTDGGGEPGQRPVAYGGDEDFPGARFKRRPCSGGEYARFGLGIYGAGGGVQEGVGEIGELGGPRGNLTLCAINAKGEHAALAIRQHQDAVPYYVASDGDEKPVYNEAKDFVAVE